MAKKRSHKRHTKRRSRRGMSSIRHVKHALMSNRLWNGLAAGSGIFALVSQTTSNDYAYAVNSGYWQKLQGFGKIQALLGWTASRAASVFGFSWSPFPNIVGPVKASLNPSNILNKYTGAGIAAELYGRFGSRFGLPWTSKVKKFGKPLIAGGIIGGFLDDPAGRVGSSASGLNRAGGVLASAGPIYRGGGNAAGSSYTSNLNQR